MATKSATAQKITDQTAAEEAWSGPKLIAIGAVTLAAALTFLYLISPYHGVLLP